MTIPNNYYFSEPKPTSVGGGQPAFSTTTLDAMLATNSAPAAAAVPTNTTYSNNADVKPSARFNEVEFHDRINIPWWRHRIAKVFIIFCVLVSVLAIALGVGLGVAFSRQSSTSSTLPTSTEEEAPAAGISDGLSSTGNQCFANRDELKAAVDTYIFSGCNEGASVCPDITSKYGWPMNSWCVGNVTDMSKLFRDMSTFNDDISLWNVSQVQDMSHTFYRALSFNGNVSLWDVSQVQNMSFMFRGASSFNGDLSLWDVSQVQDMRGMFTDASSFNGDISLWNVSRVQDMSYMFFVASSFNGNVSLWDISQVRDMQGMFNGASSFNVDVSSWDISQVQDMRYMFEYASSFNQNLCAWADKNFPHDWASDIFSDSGCTYQSTPKWSAGPFCASACNNIGNKRKITL